MSSSAPRPLAILVVFFIATATAPPARAQSAENVLLVVNDTSSVSVRIGEYYAKKRAIPQDQIVHLKLDATPKDDIARTAYNDQIQAPIAKWIAQHNAHDRILYIVLTKGIPLRIAGTSGRNGTVASVDSELALLYRRMAGIVTPVDGPLPNPYFLGDAKISTAARFTHQSRDIFLVTRLDGFKVEDVLALVDRSVAPVAAGRFVLDQKAAWQDKGNDWLRETADWLEANGFSGRVVFDTTSAALTDQSDVLGYYSWGSNDPAIKERHLGLKFVPGAVAATYVSTDARTFNEPSNGWHTGAWTDRASFYAGSPQSLTGDLIRDGVTGAAGHVAEPYLDGTVRPNILFPAYASGFNLAEAFYLAMPYVSWQTVVVGDPLCAPFPAKTPPLTRADIDKGMDSATELPALFARRALQAAAAQTNNGDVASLLVRADGCLARDDKVGARAALEQVVGREPRLVSSQLTLAGIYEEQKEYGKAIECYRAILKVDANHVFALNNLAFALAVRERRPAEALPVAERAYALVNSAENALAVRQNRAIDSAALSERQYTLAAANAPVIDTLGWVYHLTGDDKHALPLLAQAARLAPSNGEIQLHLAVVYAANGMLDDALKALGRAVELDAALDKDPETIALRARLGGKK